MPFCYHSTVSKWLEPERLILAKNVIQSFHITLQKKSNRNQKPKQTSNKQQQQQQQNTHTHTHTHTQKPEEDTGFCLFPILSLAFEKIINPHQIGLFHTILLVTNASI